MTLEELVRGVVARDVEDLVAVTRRLDAAIRALAGKPDGQAQGAAQSALREALPIWKRAYAFRTGPLADANVYLRAMFWPIRPSGIDELLSSATPVDESVIERAGANQKGLYALEYVLFGRARPNGVWSEQLLRFLERASANVLGYAERGKRRFGDGQEYARRFAEGAQDSVSKLVELTVDAVEVVFGKFDRVRKWQAERALGPSDVEGYFSGCSLELALALLDGAESLFEGEGGGLATLLGARTPELTERVRKEFETARRLVASLALPLERGVAEKSAAFAAAAAEVRRLERTLKLEVPNALGLSLVITSGDGD